MTLAPGTRLGVYEVIGTPRAGAMGEFHRARGTRLWPDVALEVLPEAAAARLGSEALVTPGARLGQYEIVAPLGAGGMGEVYRARHLSLDREVAVKLLPPRLASDEAARARFEREARAVAALSHPNILAIHDFGQQDGVVYAVTELLRGETLRALVGRGALPTRKVVQIGASIADGLAAAHERGIIHRDIKPENVFITDDGHVKILDFGLARQEVTALADETSDGQTFAGATESGHGVGHGRIHGAGAGQRANRRSACRHLRARVRAVRDGVGPSRLLARNRARDDDGDPSGRPARHRRRSGHAAGGVRERRAPLPREAGGGALPVRA